MFDQPSIFVMTFGLLLLPTCMTYVYANIMMPSTVSLYRCGLANVVESIVVVCFLGVMAIFGLERIFIQTPALQFIGYGIFGMMVFRWILSMRWTEALVINLLSTLSASFVCQWFT